MSSLPEEDAVPQEGGQFGEVEVPRKEDSVNDEVHPRASNGLNGDVNGRFREVEDGAVTADEVVMEYLQEAREEDAQNGVKPTFKGYKNIHTESPEDDELPPTTTTKEELLSPPLSPSIPDDTPSFHVGYLQSTHRRKSFK